MKPYTELRGFEDLVLEESYVLAIRAVPGGVVFEVEFALTRGHPAYTAPSPSETECFRVGQLRFIDVRRLVWDRQGAPPATDASGELDHGHIDALAWDDGHFRLHGDWGTMEVTAARAEVELTG